MDDQLHVFWDDRFVGRLTLDEQGLTFQYDESWLSSEGAAPISAKLPLQKESFPDTFSRCFFANLLPEGNVRPMIARQLGVSEGNDFALLKALGGDCAGALSLWPEQKPAPRPVRYEPVSSDQLDAMIDEMAFAPLITAGKDLRLSLAGAQQKIPLMMENDRFFLPYGSAPSTHIVKPDIAAFPGSSINEAFCMDLAQILGIPTPKTRLWRGRHTALIVDRYDRKRSDNGPWTRIHQEDFCQALGVPHSKKYEADGGPGLQKAFALLGSDSTQPIPDKTTLLRATIFNVCIGNMDAHAKNFSMLIEAKSYRLAPLYDLISTRVYGSLSPKLAMRIGGQARSEWLTKAHWQKLSQEAGIAPKVVMETVQDIAERLPDLCPKVRARFEPRGDENSLLDKLTNHIAVTCKGLLSRLTS